MEKNKKSIIEKLKSDSVSFKKWYKYVYLYNVIITKLTINECISFLEALINTNVILNTNDEKKLYSNIVKKLQNDLNLFSDLKEMVKTKKIDKKTKI